MLPLQETSDIHNTIKLHSGMDLQNQRKSYGTVIYIYIYIYIYIIRECTNCVSLKDPRRLTMCQPNLQVLSMVREKLDSTFNRF